MQAPVPSHANVGTTGTAVTAHPADLPPQNPDDLLPNLVAQVYQEATPALRGHLLQHLLKPLSLLSLAAVANGLFARLTLGDGWAPRTLSNEDISRVDNSDVVALVSHVQQVSVQAVENLSKIITSSPVLAGSAAAAMLLTLLAKQRRNRAPILGNDFDPNI
jgi:hypothetical protein